MPKIRYKKLHQNEKSDDFHIKSQGESRLINNDEYSNLVHTDTETPDGFPSSIFFIIGNEFCERFSYYGLRTVLAIYLSSELLFTEDSATSLYHFWTFLCYSTTILGAILADSFLGRYRTIFYLSLVYLVGNITLSFASVNTLLTSLTGKKTFSVLGLVLIAFGTGGIKPCVSAFGGDQFELPRQENLLTKFFAIFYFSINAGSLLSTILTPILREDVSCFGGDCFPLAFGVPAILMVVALVVFLFGTPRYKIFPPEGNVALEVVKCIGFAAYKKVSNLRRSSYETENECDSWIDLAGGRFPVRLIKDVKVLLRVLTLYVPLPLFWALFDQQGSRWTFQAMRMSGKIGSWTIKPDQMQVVNPLLIMLLIPLFDSVIYPWFDSMKILRKPLHRMFVGGLLAALSFVVSGVIQIRLESQIPSSEHNWKILGVNASPCKSELNFEFLPPIGNVSRSVSSLGKVFAIVEPNDEHLLLSDSSQSNVGISAATEDCNLISKNRHAHLDLVIDRQYIEVVVLSEYLGNLKVVALPKRLVNPFTSDATLRIVDASDFLRHSSIKLRYQDKVDIEVTNNFYSKGISASEFITLNPGRYEVLLSSELMPTKKPVISIEVEESSSKILLIYNLLTADKKVYKGAKLLDTSPPTIHMFWILPQYILISVGEIMFSVTGLEFSFKQAPQSMKSVVQAAWLLTTAFGNLIVVVIAQSKFVKKQSLEFFAFACLMVVDMVLFLFLAGRFEQSEPPETIVSPEQLEDSSEDEMMSSSL